VATVYKRNSTYWVRFQWHGKEPPTTPRKPLLSSSSPGISVNIVGSTVAAISAEPTEKLWDASPKVASVRADSLTSLYRRVCGWSGWQSGVVYQPSAHRTGLMIR
jgi:hypothetical protein